MPRTARIIVDGGTYHVLTRGNNRQTVFHDERDYQRYLWILSGQALEYGLKIHHFVLMPNHVHLLLAIGRAGMLSKAMLGINLTYALYYQRRYKHVGHVWQGRFKSLLIEQESYLLECGRYIELNPVRASLAEDAGAYPWSSYEFYARGRDSGLLTPNPLYELMGSAEAERRAAYQRFVSEGLRSGFVFIPVARRGRPRKVPHVTAR